MVILKKIKGATLMETLVATVLIIVIFMLSSMILNNLFSTNVKNNTSKIRTHLNELHYLIIHDKITLPYKDTYHNWNITITKMSEAQQSFIVFNAVHDTYQKTIEFTAYESP